MSGPIIVVEDVYKSYPLYGQLSVGFKRFLFRLPQAVKEMSKRKFWALQGLSFEVYRGEALGLFGHNGAGKSTLLGLLAGIMLPTSGRVLVRGRVAALLELGAGFHTELTGRENIILNGILLGLTKRQVLARYDAIVEFSELGSFIEQPIRVYSSGMLARLGFSVAIHVEPEILLVDEILGVGDVAFQEKCRERMQRLRHEGVTTVAVSQSPEGLRALCDRILYLDHGRVVKIETAGKDWTSRSSNSRLASLAACPLPSLRKGDGPAPSRFIGVEPQVSSAGLVWGREAEMRQESSLEFRKLGPELEVPMARFFGALSANDDFRNFHPHALTPEEARTRCAYDGKDLYYVAVVGGAVVGYGMLRGWDEGFDVPSLGIAVHPSVRGTGLGKAFLSFLHAAARQRGARGIRLKVYTSNTAAFSLYKQMGYRFEEIATDEAIGFLDL